MDIVLARSLAQQLVTALGDDPVSATGITTPDQFDRVMSAAIDGDTIILDPSFVYPSPLILDKRLTITCMGTIPPGRVYPGWRAPVFQQKVVFNRGGYITGVRFQNTNPGDNIVEAYGVFSFDRCLVIGQPGSGAKRGIAAFPAGGCSITRSYIDDCFQPSPGSDSQAIAMWSGNGLIIDDCFLRAGSETLLFGGADSATADLMPRDIAVRNCTITKRPEWRGRPIGVKNAIEIKAGRTILIENNDVQYSWAQGQVGYLLLLNVRNQDGTAPWSTIEDVVIRNNVFAHGASAFSILGVDYLHPSGRMAHVNISGNTFTDLDPDTYQTPPWALGTDKLILMQGGPIDLTISGNHFDMVRQPSSQIYFDWSGSDRVKAHNLVVADNTWPKSLYGIFGTEGSANNAHNSVWDAFVESGQLGPNTEV